MIFGTTTTTAWLPVFRIDSAVWHNFFLCFLAESWVTPYLFSQVNEESLACAFYFLVVYPLLAWLTYIFKLTQHNPRWLLFLQRYSWTNSSDIVHPTNLNFCGLKNTHSCFDVFRATILVEVDEPTVEVTTAALPSGLTQPQPLIAKALPTWAPC